MSLPKRQLQPALLTTVPSVPGKVWEGKIGPPLKSRNVELGDTASAGAGASPICFSRAAASHTVARGRIPGSVKLVCSRQLMTKKKRMAAMMGMARVSWRARKGQLEREREREMSRYLKGSPGHSAPAQQHHLAYGLSLTKRESS